MSPPCDMYSRHGFLEETVHLKLRPIPTVQNGNIISIVKGLRLTH